MEHCKRSVYRIQLYIGFLLYDIQNSFKSIRIWYLPRTPWHSCQMMAVKPTTDVTVRKLHRHVGLTWKELNIYSVWSNFEIGDLDLWRSEAYSKFFDFLDRKGGFYYERWGDAPVHSIGAALFAKKEQIHFFNDIGYRHEPFQHCPQGDAHKRGKCWCDPVENFGGILCLTKLRKYTDMSSADYEWYSCLNRYDKMF